MPETKQNKTSPTVFKTQDTSVYFGMDKTPVFVWVPQKQILRHPFKRKKFLRGVQEADLQQVSGYERAKGRQPIKL